MNARALVFAGQGAQFVGMGRDLAEAYPECAAIFKRADETLGYAVSDICFNGPEEELRKTSRCQPAIFVASVACRKAFELAGGNTRFAATGGLSLGEWTALHSAGALSFEDTVRILEARGRFMQEACEEREGAMVSVIGLTEAKLGEICAETGVEISNLNSDTQIVISGERQKIEQASDKARAAGAKRTIALKVAGAYHSSLMASAAKRLEEMLAQVRVEAPAVPVVANVTGLPHGAPDQIRNDMVRQVTSPVQWVKCVRWFKANGITSYLECGPGRVVSGLIQGIDRDAAVFNVQDRPTLEKAVQNLNS